MKRLVLSLMAVSALCVLAGAQADKPQLPRVPRGFDEGRIELTEEAADARVLPGALVERLFEEADLTDLAAFTHRHLLADEKRALDESLALGGVVKCKDASAVLALMQAKPVSAAQVAKAIGAMLAARKYALPDVCAWLYARGFNFRILQRAMNGERLDALRLRRQLRALPDRSAAKVFTPGIWEYNLLDAREEQGGTYDGPQLVEALLAIGWGAADFAAAAGVNELPDARRALVEWGEATQIWTMMESYLSESDLVRHVIKRYAAKDDPRVLEVALLRAATVCRWFRTGGPGVTGVYRGPWPDAKGQPVPPSSRAHEIGDVDGEQFVTLLDKSIHEHFATQGESITLVVYDDGSARAFLDRPGRDALEYTADTPLGEGKSTRQCYEGRVSISGRNGLLYLVYADQVKSAPPEFELANVKLAAGDRFFTADLDDGLNLTPILLRKITRLVE